MRSAIALEWEKSANSLIAPSTPLPQNGSAAVGWPAGFWPAAGVAKARQRHTVSTRDRWLMGAYYAPRPERTGKRRQRMKAAAVVADILKREGVKFLIGYPVNQIIEAAAEADIRTIIVRQERVGLHMADALSRVTSGDRIGVFAMQHGPGTENSFGGVAQAFGDSVPIVVLPGGYPRHLLNITPNFSSWLNYQHVTKWAEQVILPQHVPDAMRRAFTQVKNGRPRPVLVEIPVDVMR